ncbi:hypothetical protein [Burkholderia sp. S-53]|uniref:hypothetical protein n=1 Tax=Burkholderia sp. S-53 TaxID=2906514 RepID=UPI0021CEAB97|nr:hypothetical protein [Burkholderia sp. S-53]UXU90787.1 hypothetical protein LXM88_36520 [Burkholderia sp. S-53]
MTLPDGPRYDISPSAFHQLRRHYRGELIGEIKAELRRDAVRAIDSVPYPTKIESCDCFIRADREHELWPTGYPDAQHDDLSDLIDWQPHR